MDPTQNMERVLAWLLRNEGVHADAIERAISAAVDMKVGEATCLSGPGPVGVPAAMRRAFVTEQVGRLSS